MKTKTSRKVNARMKAQRATSRKVNAMKAGKREASSLNARHLSKSRTEFLRSAALLVEAFHDRGLVSRKAAAALKSSLEKSVTRKHEGFALSFSANLFSRVRRLIADSSLSDRDKRHREMNSFEAISRIASSAAGEEKCLEKCLSALRDVIPFQNGALFVLREDTGKLELEATIGYPQDLIESVKFDLGQGLSAWAAREKKSIFVRELTRPEKEGLERLGSFLAVPIIAGARSVGVITMGHSQPGAFISDHKRILQLFCTLLSGTVLSLTAEKKGEALAAV